MSAGKPSRDSATATLWIVVPFALAVVGTVVMLFTNSANALKVSLVLALWAGAAGIILAARLRRDRDAAEREFAARSQRYEAELDAAHARGEADRQALLRNDAPASTPGVDVEVLREIQAELTRLRAQLEELSGREFGYEPAALHAEARRVAEIESTAGSTRREEPATSEPDKPASGPSTDDTAEIKRVRDEARGGQQAASEEPVKPERTAGSRPAGAPSADAIAGRFGSQRDAADAGGTTRVFEVNRDNNPLSQLISERQQEQRRAEPAPQPAPKPEPAPEPSEEPREEPAAHGGRRRRDEHGRGSLTVAELLARSARVEKGGDA